MLFAEDQRAVGQHELHAARVARHRGARGDCRIDAICALSDGLVNDLRVEAHVQHVRERSLEGRTAADAHREARRLHAHVDHVSAQTPTCVEGDPRDTARRERERRQGCGHRHEYGEQHYEPRLSDDARHVSQRAFLRERHRERAFATALFFTPAIGCVHQCLALPGNLWASIGVNARRSSRSSRRGNGWGSRPRATPSAGRGGWQRGVHRATRWVSTPTASHTMHVESILRRLQPLPGFVYGSIRWMSTRRGQVLHVDIGARKGARAVCSGCFKKGRG